MPRRSASMQTSASVEPAAPSRCPIADLVEEIGGASGPNRVRIASDSTRSLIGVPVQWAEMKPISAGARPASSSAARIAIRAPAPNSSG